MKKNDVFECVCTGYGADGEGIIFRKGVIVRKVPESELVAELFREIDKILEDV